MRLPLPRALADMVESVQGSRVQGSRVSQLLLTGYLWHRRGDPSRPMRDTATSAEHRPVPAVPIDRAAIAEFCRRDDIRRLALFGSVLRSDFAPESDVDVLLESQPRARVGLFRFVALQEGLSRLIGRRVDLRSPDP